MFVFRSTQGLKLTQARNQVFIWISLAELGLAWPGLDWGLGGVWIGLDKTALVCVFSEMGRRWQGANRSCEICESGQARRLGIDEDHASSQEKSLKRICGKRN